jgi:hypothetical protein
MGAGLQISAGNWCSAVWVRGGRRFYGVLVAFRERLIAHDLDRRLLDRTVALPGRAGALGGQHLRAALDRRRCSGRDGTAMRR